MSINQKRMQKDIWVALSTIVSEELTNSNISYPTITDVKLAPDLSSCIVFVTFYKNSEKSLEGLKRATGFIRREISYRTNLRRSPILIFKLDKSFENGQKIDKLIEKIKNEEGE